MPNLNKTLLMGHLTRDPELRYTPNNTAVCAFGLAVNRRWKNQQGEAQEEVTFVDLEAWGRTAEVINQYVKRGDPLFVEGRLKLDQWTDKDGGKRSKLKVVVESFQFLSSKQDAGQGQQATRTEAPAPAAAPAGGGSHVPVGDEDIPFHHDTPHDW